MRRPPLFVAALLLGAPTAEAAPVFTGLGDADNIVVRAVSSDGASVVGYFDNAAGDREAFRWDAVDGLIGLGDLPGGKFKSEATAVSADGAVVVGRSKSSNGSEAFLWDAGGGMVGLGDLPGGAFNSEATDVSQDGRVVVGVATTAAGQEAFVWDAGSGMRRLVDVLLDDFGLDLGGWTLDSVSALSSDGSTIVGEGTNPDGRRESFVVTGVAPSQTGDGDSGSSGSGSEPASAVPAIPVPGLALLAAFFATAVARAARRAPDRSRR